MEQTEELYHLLPRHIRKMVRAKLNQPQPKAVQEGYLDASNPISLWGTVGTDEQYNTYPDANASKLKEELVRHMDMDARKICIGNGATELIDLAIRAFCTPGKDRILCFATGNERVKHFAQMNALEIDELELEVDFEMPICKPEAYFQENTKVMVIENPNQLIGRYFAQYDIVDWISKFEGIVILDESAIDYAPERSLVELLEHFKNVIVIQSFSRAWGLAGLPVGVAYANPELIQVLDIIKPPFSVNVAAQRMATKALYVADQKDRIVARTNEERMQVKAALEKLPVVTKVHESETNTLLVEVEHAEIMARHLLEEEQIIVRNVSDQVGIEHCLCITIGQGIDNMRIVKAFKDMPMKTSPGRLFLRRFSETLRQASSYLGMLKNIFGMGA